MVVLFANSGDPDQMSHSAASDLILHCLPITPLGVSRLQWVRLQISPMRKSTSKSKMPFVSMITSSWSSKGNSEGMVRSHDPLAWQRQFCKAQLGQEG